MKSYLLLISAETKNKDLLKWLFKTALKALNINNVIVDINNNSNYETIVINNQTLNSQLSTIDLKAVMLNNSFVFDNEGIILNNGFKDELTTAFYLINSVQEYNSNNIDNIGRFKFESSYQKRFNIIDKNFVTTLFENYFLKYFPYVLNNRVYEKSEFFFSHDIDSLFGAFLQDGLAALKKGRLDIIAKLIFNVIIFKPEWFNIDEILKINNEYNLKATFFWIVNKGRVNKTLTNADYNINSTRVKKTIQSVINNKSFVGLHKSISSETFNQELLKLNSATTINRNHYLRFKLPEHYQSIDNSSLKIDCSLGFAEHYGFRNSLAIPFVPFNVEIGKPYNFLEVPLNIMDGTFQKYMNLPPEQASQKIIEFIEKNKTNSVISVLWHNHFFNSYRFGNYFKPYKTLLTFIKEEKYSFITPENLFTKYYIG